MIDPTSTGGERIAQREFTFQMMLALCLMVAAVLGFDRLMRRIPDQALLGPRFAAIRFDPVALDRTGFAPLRLRGAWRVRIADQRFGGISALAWDDGALLALSDAGALVRFAPPGSTPGQAELRELPAGPGDARFKRRRDAEALSADPNGRGWWVAFENADALWLYDHQFTRALARFALGADRFASNAGIEGLVPDRAGLLLLAEDQPMLLRWDGARLRGAAVTGVRGRIADAARLPDGRILLIEQRAGSRGFANALIELERGPRGNRIGRRFSLALGALDNAEALAAQPLPGGGVRLWMMTDDNFQRPLRTLLVTLDMPAPKPGRRN